MLTDFQIFSTVGKRMKCAAKLIRYYSSHRRHVVHYLGKLKMQIFSRYSAHMEENTNKLHFYRLHLCNSSTNFDIFSV